MLVKALREGKWQTCIDCVKSLPPAKRKKVLLKHHLQNMPTMHFLAKSHITENDTILINEIVRLFVDSGYDINKKKARFFLDSLHIEDGTALMVAAALGNKVLVKCLIQNGAKKDLLDSKGQSAYHWAVMYGSLNCLKTLIYDRTANDVDETKEIKDLIYDYSLLHKAVESGHQEIVAFLIEDQLCDPTKKARFSELIPLQLAILTKQWNIAAYLIRVGSDISVVANIKKEDSRHILWNSVIAGNFNSFGLLLKLGDNKALPVLDVMLHQGMEKALNCPSADLLRAAVQEKQPDFVERIFNHYVQDKLDDESALWLRTFLITSPIDQNRCSPGPFNQIPHNWHCSIGEYTLLHFACIYECSPDFLEKLVKHGADVNSMTTGLTKLTPLHISIIQKQWASVCTLITNGADLRSTAVFTWNVGTVHKIQSFDTIHMLLHLSTGCRKCCSTTNFFLCLMNQDNYVSWVGVKVLGLAVISGSPECILKALEHCSKTIPLNDLMWFAISSGQLYIPLLHGAFSYIKTDKCDHIHINLGCLIRTLAADPYNYDFNSVAKGTIIGRGVNDHLSEEIYTPLFFRILETDYAETNNLLTKTLLEYNHVDLNVRNKPGQNLVEYLFHLWASDNFNYRPTEEDIQAKANFVIDTVKMLIFKGCDVTTVTIDEKFRYHNGFMPIIKLMYRAGANITPSFFLPRQDFPSNSDDHEKLKIWKEVFDQHCKSSLEHRCRILIRSSIQTVGDATRVMYGKPEQLKKYVLELHEKIDALN